MSSLGTPARPGALVQRDEWRRLDSAVDRAVAGNPSVLVLAGDAGVGKSCLLRSFAETADATVLFGSCVTMGERGPPLLPIMTALQFGPDDEFVTGEIAEVREVLTTGRFGGEQRPLGDRTEMFRTILELFERLAEHRPTLVVIEDLHAADSSTLDLVTFILSNLRQQRLAVMVSYRSDDLVADHPWRPSLAEMVRHPRVDHVDLPAFDRRQVTEQLTTLRGEVPDEATLDEVMRRTRGNAFFVEELVDHGQHSSVPLPLSLRDLLLVKVEALSDSTCALLRIMALGRPETTDEVLAAVAGISVEDVRRAQREALDRRVLAVGPSGPVFRHALVREALELDLLAGERRGLHGAYASALATTVNPSGPARAGDIAALAGHWFGAGKVADAMRLWVESADAAETMFAYRDAHLHLENVLQQWDRVERPEQLTASSRGQILVRAAEDAFLGGQPERACELAREAMGWVNAAADPRAAGILYERLARYTVDTPERDRALEYSERAVALVSDSPATADRARVLAGWVRQLMLSGRQVEAHAAAPGALDIARACGASEVEGDVLNTFGVLTCALDDVERGLTMIRSALEIARTRRDGFQQMRAHWNIFACTFDAGRWEQSLERFEEAKAALPRLGQGHLVADLYRYAADVLMRLGRWEESDALIDEGRANLPGRRNEFIPVEMMIARGLFDESRELIAERMNRNVHVDEEAFIWSFVNLADVETWSGRTAEARFAIDEVFDMAIGCDFTLSVAYVVAIGLSCEADAADRARKNSAAADERVAIERAQALLERIHELLERPGPVDGWKREVGALARQSEAEFSRAVGASDPEAWASVASAWRDLAMPYEVARSQFGQAAALLDARTDRAQAAELLADAGVVATRLHARPLQARIDALARRARLDIGSASSEAALYGLTDREREVLALLATGASNRGIATTLFISVRTAGVHVSSILRKLGVANRAEATSVAFRDGLVS